MPINFIHNQIQTQSTVVREKLPLPVKLLAGAAGMVLLVAISLAAYRLLPSLPFFESSSSPEQGKAQTIVIDGTETALFLLPEEMQAALEQNPHCPLEVALCPDGSKVGRVGPNCEFALCSGDVAPASPDEVFSSFSPSQPQMTNEAVILPPESEEEFEEWRRQRAIEDGVLVQ